MERDGISGPEAVVRPVEIASDDDAARLVTNDESCVASDGWRGDDGVDDVDTTELSVSYCRQHVGDGPLDLVRGETGIEHENKKNGE